MELLLQDLVNLVLNLIIINNQLEEVKENNERNDLKENQKNHQTYQKLNIYKSDLLPNQHN